jgi:hypothetical protein
MALALLLASAVAASAAPIAWVAPSFDRVKPDAAAGSATEISLYAAKGEYESFQIIVRGPTGGLTNVNVLAPTLAAARFTLYREHYVYVAHGSADWATNHNKPLGIGWYPDGLIPFVNPATGADLTGATLDAVPFGLAANTNQPIWIDVCVPRDAAAGQYRGTFTVTSNQGQATVALNLTVWNFALPVKPYMKSSFLYSAVRRQTQPDQVLLENRLMPIAVATSNERTFIETLGLNSTNMGFWANASKSAGTATPAPTVSAVLTEKAKHQQDLWFYAYTFDEISPYLGPSEPTLRDEVLAYARALHGAGVDQLITTPPNTTLFDDGTATGRSAVDVWVELPKQYDATLVNQAIAKGDEVWSYNCLQQDNYTPKWLLDYAPINYRIQPGFVNQSLNMTGLLYWRADDWTSDPWNDPTAYSDGYPGEGLLVYPATQVGLTGVMPSMRLKYLRDGVDDYDYIQMLKERGYGSWALGVARTVGPDWTNWTRDFNALESARRQLGEMLNNLSSPHTLPVTASVSPTTVASGGSASLSATATDSSGHGIASWSWSDGGAAGSFSPSATAQNPTYVAAANTTGGDRTVTLTVTATCNGPTPAAGSGSATLTVQSSAHTLSVTAAASPTTVASAGSTAVSASATDSLGHGVATWSWSDGGAGGSFAPSASAQNSSYIAPGNSSDSAAQVTLTVTATCAGPPAISRSASTTVSVNPVAHTLSVSAGALPTTVASGGSTSLSASAVDSRGHGIIGWQWGDGGAGGSFTPSPNVSSPTYAAAANTTGGDRIVTLTVTATCNGPTPIGSSASTTVTVQPAPHDLTVVASASPAVVASGGAVSLSATATDTLDHAIATWSWYDGGASGSFAPSANVSNPTYTAAENTTGADRIVTLTVTATCNGATRIDDSSAVSVTVRPVAAALPVDASVPVPAVVPSESTASLAATTNDSTTDQVASWRWDDGGANGAFLPSAAVRTPQYRAPRNASGRDMQIVLTVAASCSVPVPAAGVDSTSIVVQPAPHTLVVSASADPNVVSWKGRSQLSAAANDSLGHGIAQWVWSDSGAGGSFSPSAQVQNPTYRVPANSSSRTGTIILSVSATCDGPNPLTATGYLALIVQPKPGLRTPSLARVAGGRVQHLTGTGSAAVISDAVPDTSFPDLPAGFWATDSIEACRRAGILGGFPDGTYRPDILVNRGQVAVYVARAVAGGDDLVPAGPGEASFSDVPTRHWAYRYVEYAAANGIVTGFPDGSYHPADSVNRAEMAAFVARSLVTPTGDEGLQSYQPPDTPTFADVPASHWAYRYVEFLAERGIASGYADGTFQAAKACTRAEMAVYLARGFGLGT